MDARRVVVHFLFTQLLQGKDSLRVANEDFRFTVSHFLLILQDFSVKAPGVFILETVFNTHNAAAFTRVLPKDLLGALGVIAAPCRESAVGAYTIPKEEASVLSAIGKTGTAHLQKKETQSQILQREEREDEVVTRLARLP